ncbi:TetR/AcrR family transcriptional regulator [Acinetobacter stercoris]|uniref:DNA-binding transcriptional repressor AcrR n=1 Tax=Acinetobacter stercoris TaxID=2126983 RepID=A0A2U3MX03_9GAMM|nr:TetR/AcrR family transcriptional regulator [Acinetobacter stercoris]SPL69829.1 DNA-binding transcriptional repressor AcrR [Acinetobacter stercoris]
MRYKIGYKEEKRNQLLKITGQVAKKAGFQNTGIDDFMKAAGVTSGAFYSHFSSKHELFKALIHNELEQSIQMWQTNPFDDPEQWIDFELERYLSLSHVEKSEYGCLLPALATEVARSDEEIKQHYQAELLRGHQIFVKYLGSEKQAWAVMCQLVGAILMARSVLDENIKLIIIESSKNMIKNYLSY